MRIEVVGRDIEVTDAIREHAEQKCDKLPRYFDGVQLITVTISQGQPHGTFHVELVVDAEKHENFVSHANGDDLYGAIEQAVNKASRQLKDFKERLKQEKR